MFKNLGEQATRDSAGSLYGHWDLILQQYTACHLTKGKDKFVALSAVVREFESILGDEYLAGLWEGNLVNGLLWCVGIAGMPDRPNSKGDLAVRPAGGYRAPSWSWASIDGRVAMPAESGRGRQWVEEVKAEVIPKGRDRTGEIAYASLKLRGYLVQFQRPDFFAVSDQNTGGCVYPDVESEFVDEVYYALPIREIEDGRGVRDHKGRLYLYGLVLKRVTGQDAGCFQRLGLFKTSKNDPLEILGRKKAEGWDSDLERQWFDSSGDMEEIVII